MRSIDELATSNPLLVSIARYTDTRSVRPRKGPGSLSGGFSRVKPLRAAAALSKDFPRSSYLRLKQHGELSTPVHSDQSRRPLLALGSESRTAANAASTFSFFYVPSNVSRIWCDSKTALTSYVTLVIYAYLCIAKSDQVK